MLDALARSRRCVAERPVAVRQTWLDSFDWRLHRRGWALLHEIETDANKTPAHQPSAGANHATLELRAHECLGIVRPGQPVQVRLDNRSVPKRPDDLPDGRLRQAIGPALGVRCLVPVATALTHRWSVRVLNSDEKTVAWVLAETTTLTDGSQLGTRVRVLPVLGYPRASLETASVLEDDLGLTITEGARSAALSASGRRAGDYSSKLTVPLRRSDSFDAAVRALLRHLMGTLQANLAGTRANLDPEFLHDIRVAVRRSRSLLGEAARYLADLAAPDDPITGLRDELAWLGEVTGPTRDLDVWLVTLDEELAAGSPVHEELGALRQIIEERRRAAHRELVETLDSVRFRELLAEWARASNCDGVQKLQSITTRTLPDAAGSGQALLRSGLLGSTRVGPVAATLVQRAHARVLQRGRAISPDSADQALHDVRKAAKRLRYLLESFESLCGGEVLDEVVSELKALQDNLGEFQDCAAQADSLAGLGQELGLELGKGAEGRPEALIAIGYLVAGLESRRARAREDFARRFGRFERPEARALVAAVASGLASGRSPLAGGGTRTKGSPTKVHK